MMKSLDNATSHTDKRNEVRLGLGLPKQKCNIDLNSALAILLQQKGLCAYSGRPMVYGTKKDWACSMERIDIKLGYTSDNICFICAEFNGTDHSEGREGVESGGWSRDKFLEFTTYLRVHGLPAYMDMW